MTIEVHPATHARFDDAATVLGPRKPQSSVCWCLTYRLPSSENRALTGTDRRDRVEQLTRGRTPPGVLAYLDGEVVGWAGVAPRADLHSFATSRRIPHVDDLPVWTIWCFRVRGGLRGKGIATALLDGAVAARAGRSFPWGTLAVNLSGAFVLGTGCREHIGLGERLRDAREHRAGLRADVFRGLRPSDPAADDLLA